MYNYRQNKIKNYKFKYFPIPQAPLAPTHRPTLYPNSIGNLKERRKIESNSTTNAISLHITQTPSTKFAGKGFWGQNCVWTEWERNKWNGQSNARKCKRARMKVGMSVYIGWSGYLFTSACRPFMCIVSIYLIYVCSLLHHYMRILYIFLAFLWICEFVVSLCFYLGGNFSVCRLHLIRSEGLLRFNHRFFLTIFGLVFYFSYNFFPYIFPYIFFPWKSFFFYIIIFFSTSFSCLCL